jgi:hypothetical protein
MEACNDENPCGGDDQLYNKLIWDYVIRMGHNEKFLIVYYK